VADGEREDSDSSSVDTDAEPPYAVPTGTDSEEALWAVQLASAGELIPTAVDRLVEQHGERGVRAVEAVSENRIKKYNDFMIVVGHEDEYIIEAARCTCKDSQYNLDAEDKTQHCWHVLAVAIAERIGELDYHDMWYTDVREFL